MVHDANADLVKELRIPSDVGDSAIQEALMRLFNAQVQEQSESDAVEGQAIRAKRSVSESDHALKAKSSDQALKPSRSVQFNLDVSVSSNSSQSSS